MTPTFDPQAFWVFSLQQYALDGMKDYCLGLQNNHGVDINLLLLCHWLDSQALVASEDTLNKLIQISDHWQHTVLRPLRTGRSAIDKPGAPYQTALANELAEEKNEQRALVACINGPAALSDEKPHTAGANLVAYAAKKQFPLGHGGLLNAT